jgi:hypothetical protein
MQNMLKATSAHSAIIIVCIILQILGIVSLFVSWHSTGDMVEEARRGVPALDVGSEVSDMLSVAGSELHKGMVTLWALVGLSIIIGIELTVFARRNERKLTCSVRTIGKRVSDASLQAESLLSRAATDSGVGELTALTGELKGISKELDSLVGDSVSRDEGDLAEF